MPAPNSLFLQKIFRPEPAGQESGGGTATPASGILVAVTGGTVKILGAGNSVFALFFGLILAIAFGACTSEDDRLKAICAQAKVSRSAAATAMVQAYHNHQIHHDRAIGYATEMLQNGQDETAFGGAVLDFMDQVKGDFKTDPEYELFWMGVGRLAFWSAHVAYEKGRTDEALELVFAGPKRWQVESYWLMYPDHDALASYILDSAGKHAEAVTRLRNRSDVSGEAEQALETLTRGAK